MESQQVGLIFKALEFAARKHRDQRRKDLDASPYINHPISLVNLLWNTGGVSDPAVVMAALLHDTVEDTETTFAELRQEFGEAVEQLVREVTDDKSLPKPERKQRQVEHAAHLSQQAKWIKLADKISNLRDIIASPPADWSSDRKREYFIWAKQVVDQVRGANARLEAVFDEVYQQGMSQLGDR
jgi:guanosine-3',5'-bis(diphosphate) 3'-pyrophosphohydrolase